MKKTLLTLLISIFILTTPFAVSPPEQINYQGVLRDNNDEPLTGSYDMVFRLYDDPAAGNLLLTDSHLASGTGYVAVTGGLFNVAIGSGAITTGTESTLSNVFANNTAVYLEVQIGAETLNSRIQVISSASALNANNLDGLDSTAFSLDGHDHNTLYYTETELQGDGSSFVHWNNLTNVPMGLGDGDTLDQLTCSDGQMAKWSNVFSAWECAPDVDTDTTYTASTGITLIGSEFQHEDTSTQSNVFNSNGTVVEDVAFDGFGHVTGVTSYNLDGRYFTETELSTDTFAQVHWNNLSNIPADIADGGDADTLDGYNSTAFMSSSADSWVDETGDTMTGNLYLNGGSIGVGVSPVSSYGVYSKGFDRAGVFNGNRWGLDVDVDANTTSSINGIEVTAKNSVSSSTPIIYGVFSSAQDGGTSNNGYVCGIWSSATGSSSGSSTLYGLRASAGGSSGTSYGVYGIGTSNNPSFPAYGVYGEISGTGNNTAVYGSAFDLTTSGEHTAVRGEATGLGTNYGGRFSASGGTTNWGIYVTGNGYISGLLDFGSGSDDDLKASDVSTLTGGGSADGLHDHNWIGGLPYTSFLRSDADDTASGIITFTAGTTDIRGSIVDNDLSDTNVNIGENLYVEGENLGINTAPVSNRAITTSGSTVYGGYLIGSQYGSYNWATNNASWDMYGSYCVAQNNNFLSGTTYGLYAEASGGLESWGIYTPDDASVNGTLRTSLISDYNNSVYYLDPSSSTTSARLAGDLQIGYGDTADDDYLYFDQSAEYFVWQNSLSRFFLSDDLQVSLNLLVDGNAKLGVATDDTHTFWGTLTSGSASDSHRILPNTSNYGYIGTSLNYWYFIYASGLRYKSIATFDDYPDLDLIDAMDVEYTNDIKTGERYMTFVQDAIPDIIKGTPTPDDPHADQFIDVAKADGLLFGAVKQLRQEGRDRETSLREELDLRTPDEETGIQEMNGNLQLVLDRDANESSRMSVFRNGETGISEELMRLDEEGNLHIKGALKPNALDLAEYHPVNGEFEIGDVLVMDPYQEGRLTRCNLEADPMVFGIVSGSPGVALGSGLDRIAELEPDLAMKINEARYINDTAAEEEAWLELQTRFETSHAAVALSGVVPCKVDASYGSIQRGDLLVASPNPGYAMRADSPVPGTIIGKAVQKLEDGEGVINVLVMLR